MTSHDTGSSGTGSDDTGASARRHTKPRGKIPAVSCRRLTKVYDETRAVSQLTLTVGRGEIFGLLGPNGAGKTTTILMLLGLTEPSAGTVRVLGLNPTKQALDVKRRVGYLPDAVGFYPTMTGRENLRYTAKLNGLGRAEAEVRIDEVLEIVGLADRGDDETRTYSRGMGQRLGIADALIKRPEVLILDEPTVGLDPRGADQVLATISRLAAEQNVTVLLSSHLLTQVQAICHRIGIFVGGELQAAGTIDELAAQHGGGTVIEVGVREGDPSSILRRIPGVVDVTRHSGGDDAGDAGLVGDAGDPGASGDPADAGGADDAGDGPVRWVLDADRDVRDEVVDRLGRGGFTLVHLLRRSETLGQLYRRYFSEDSHDDAA